MGSRSSATGELIRRAVLADDAARATQPFSARPHAANAPLRTTAPATPADREAILQRVAMLSHRLEAIAVAPPIQRKFTITSGPGAGDHADVKKLKTVLDLVKLDERWESSWGSTLGKMFDKDRDYGTFANVKALVDHLAERRAKSDKSQQIGKEREKQVAKSIEGSVSDTGKYNQDEVVYFDPSPQRTNHRHIKLDVKSDTIYGIVGGASKAKNLSQFKGICRDLLAISSAHERTPRVYCDPNTPRLVVDAAAAIVASENVINIATNAPWSEDIWTGPTTVIPEGGIFEMEMD